MCGIAAILSQDLQLRAAFSNRALQLLKHRGPDEKGSWDGAGVTLAHTRLSILDLSTAGDQPMQSSCGRYVMSYNGEVYNHLELRKRWLPDFTFRGHCDTETIIELFRVLRERMLSEMVGMWAFVIWDKKEERLFVSRDRYGQKPLYYRPFDNGTLAFASEIKPLLIEGEKNRGNPHMLADYLAMGNYHHLDEQTFFSDISQLSPATYAWVGSVERKVEPVKYWKLPFVERSDRILFTSAEKQKLAAVVQDAVESQTLSDVPIAATLSGGLDSSIITGMLALSASTENPVNVFTAQTPGSPYDESPFVKAVADKWGSRVRVHRKNLAEVRLSETLEAYIKAQEEPFGDPSIIAHGFLMDMAKEEGIKVVLGGQGADEIAKGYTHNIHQLLSYELAKGNRGYVLSEMRAAKYSYGEQGRIVFGGFFPQLERKFRMRSRKKRMFFLADEIRASATNAKSAAFLALANDPIASMEESIYGVHLPHLVHYDDRNSMARSIEGRMPFLDHRILETLSTYRLEDFYQGGLSKFLLREACKDVLPAEVYTRKDKIGFFTPIHEMIRSELEWVRNETDQGSFFDTDQMRRDLDVYKGADDSIDASRRIFRILSVCIWMRLFNVTL